ncbi:MAG: DNA polymerase III subunit epsilon, partial [Coriobacteriales bacterium]|nr:DNA polymerase III subunit epsilon [Coriobacteriales bacterium]
FLIPGTDPDVLTHYDSLAIRACDARFGAFEEEYVVFDTETTGLNPERDALIEVAAAILCGPEIIARFSTFVNPGRSLPPFITELTHITDADLTDAPAPCEAVGALAAFVGQRPLIAHNASFDQGFIRESCPEGRRMAESNDWIDSLECARIALPRLKEHNMEALCRAFGVVNESAHRATGDVDALARLWRIMLVALSDLPPGLPALFAGLFPKTDWALRPVFRQIAGAVEEKSFSLAEARSARERSQKKRQKIDALELDGGIATISPVESGELDAAFSATGIIASMYERFEPRAEQLLMAREVADALSTKTHRVIEAGTGVGKSVAYLLPLALFARDNRVTCGVATKSNALLDQLMYNELPRLDKALSEQAECDGINYVALKGYDHYPCLRKLMNLTREDRGFPNSSAPTTVATLLSFVCQSARGDLDHILLNWRDLPRFEVCASAEDCLRHKCRYYTHCLLHGARRAAREADIVVTNHALLFCDVMMGGGILPPVRQWVVDEAHSVEGEARQQLSLALEARTLTQALDGLFHANGVLDTLQKRAFPLEGSSLLIGKLDLVAAEAKALVAIAESFFSFVKDLVSLAEQSSYDKVDLWINAGVREKGSWGAVFTTGSSLAKRMETLWTDCRDIISLSAQFEELLEAQGDLAGLTAELKEQLDALTLILDGSNGDYVYYAELDRRPESRYDRLIAARLDIGAVLLDRFYPDEMSVVFTSATLAAGESFTYFARAAGLDGLPPETWKSVQLASSYDFERNMAVYLPLDVPEPNATGYRAALEELLFAVHTALGGSVLTLFTNRREMELVYGHLKDRLAEAHISLRSQGRGFSARRLRDEFLANRNLSLFALRSFWEGFDAPGDTLRCVVIPRLPFGRPNDPLLLERGIRGSDTWGSYTLPEAVIDLKQAAGRLIRSSTDSGALILADARLRTKGYGKTFLKALPSQQIHTLDTEGIAQALARL